MSQPKTDTFDKLKKFMNLAPAQRDESIFLQVDQIKYRVQDLEETAGKLVKSNANLQKAIYIATGIFLAAKFYFEFLAPHNP
jgi:tetrahydromethanopterin S-methyltransferase subunit B